MKLLVDMAIYIVANNKGTDHLSLGARVARELHMNSILTESFLTAIYTVEHFGLKSDLAKEAEQAVQNMSESAEYKELLKILP